MGARGPNPNTEHLYKRGRIWWCWFYDHGGTLVRRSTGATDKKAARARLAEWERASADPNHSAQQTLNDCLQALLDDRGRATTAQNVSFLTTKAKALVTVLGHDLLIRMFRDDSSISRSYIDARRQMRTPKGVVSDRTIKRELKLLKMALAMAKSRGAWSGDLDLIIPADFKPAEAPRGDSITRDQARRMFGHLSPDTAAAVAFALATGAEMAALRSALREDLPDDVTTCREVRVRGTKNQHRDAAVPIVTDEQRLLLTYAKGHGRGKDGKLFGNLHAIHRELKAACMVENVTVVSPHDLRRSAGQWMVDLGVPIELVSKFMRHANSSITEEVYASVKPEDVADRILDSIDPHYATAAHRGRKKPVVETLQAIPPPRQIATLFEVEGVAKTLTNWSKASGISKATLHNRVVTRGLSMGAALTLGRTYARPRAQRTSPKGAVECERNVKVSMDLDAPDGQKAPPSPKGTPKKPPKSSKKPARPGRFERPTNGLEDSVGRRIRRGMMRDASIRA